MTTPVFAGVAVFCSILVVWFGFETRNLCDKLSPDEYMQATLLAQQSMQRARYDVRRWNSDLVEP